jgi:hypothetical protein
MDDQNNWGTVLIPMIRKTMPSIIAQDIVGVQPMGTAVPKPSTPTGYLTELHKKYILWRAAYPDERDHTQQVTDMMQDRFPGPYVVEEFYNIARGCFDLRLKFEDPKQETMWRIKYS